MNLQSTTPEFIESFCDRCASSGMEPEKTAQLLYAAQLDEGLADPDFEDGFNKRASGILPMALSGVGHLLRGGATLGGAAVRGGLKLGLRTRLGRGALLTGGAMAGGAVASGRNPLDHLSGLTAGRSWDKKVSVPTWLRGPATPSSNRSPNAFQHIDGFALPAGKGQAAAGPLQQAQEARSRLQALDQQINSAKNRATGTGLSGTLDQRGINREVQALERERRLVQQRMLGSYYGGFKGDVNRSTRSINAREKQLIGRRNNLNTAATNLNRVLSGSRPWYAAPWEFITGAEGRARGVVERQQQTEAELRELEALRKRLREYSV
jgi:hypothetical protein